jgi:hypothetical protein
MRRVHLERLRGAARGKGPPVYLCHDLLEPGECLGLVCVTRATSLLFDARPSRQVLDLNERATKRRFIGLDVGADEGVLHMKIKAGAVTMREPVHVPCEAVQQGDGPPAHNAVHDAYSLLLHRLRLRVSGLLEQRRRPKVEAPDQFRGCTVPCLRPQAGQR